MGAVCEADQMQVDRGLIATDRHVFLRLANRHNAVSGLCWPGHAKLAEDTGLSVRTIGEALQALWRGGFVDWVERWIEGSVEQDTNLYTIHSADHPDATPEKPRLILTPKEPRQGNRPRQERPPIQVVAIPRHRPLKKKKGVEVVQQMQYPPAESALPPCGSSITPVQILHDPHATDAEKPDLNQDLKRDREQEGVRVVVVVDPKKEFSCSSSVHGVLEGRDEDEEYVKGDESESVESEPVESESVGDGSGSPQAHPDPSDQPHHHGMDQDKLDPSPNDDDASGQEYLPLGNIPSRSTEVSPQPPKAIPLRSKEKSSQSATVAAAPAAPRPLAPPDPLDAQFESTVKSQPLGSQEDACVLVQHFLDLVHPEWASSYAHWADWIRTARMMLGVNSLATLTWAITYAMKIKFWREALQQKGRGSFAFFEDRISSGGEKSLLAQSINSQPVKKMEPNHGKKTANTAATGRSASPSVDKARAIAEQAKQAGRR